MLIRNSNNVVIKVSDELINVDKLVNCEIIVTNKIINYAIVEDGAIIDDGIVEWNPKVSLETLISEYYR